MLFWLSGVALLSQLHHEVPPGGLYQSDFLAGNNSDLPVVSDSAWQRVRLPHVWSDTAGQSSLELAWYRLSIVLPERDEDDAGAAVLLWQLSMNAQLYLDGAWLGDGGRMRDPVARNEFRPLLLTVPAALATPGRHELLILLRGVPAGTGFLGPVFAGAESEMRAWYQQRARLKTQVLHLAATLIAAIAFPMGLLGLWRPHDSVYGWFAAFGMLFAANTAILTSHDVQLPAAMWEWLFAVTINVSLVALLIFVNRFLKRHQPRLERACLWASLWGNAGLAVVAWLDPDNLHYWTRGFWCSASVAMAVYPGVSIFLAYWNRLRESGFVLMLVGTLMLIVGLRDLLAINHWWVSPVNGFWTYYVVPLAFLVFSYILLRRFHLSLQEAETLNAELADRVRAKELEIEAKHALLRVAEQRQVLGAERERILSDMHDGLGGTLISTLARLDADGAGDSPVARSIRLALNDLRLMLFSLEPGTASFRSRFAMLRDRLSAQCDDVGLQFVWNLRDVPDDFVLERGQILQLMRLVQESFTNVLKHARANCYSVQMSLDTSGERLMMEISDDGGGFDPATVQGEGVGIRSMRARATSLGGQLQIASDASGSRIRLCMAVPAAA